MELVSGAILINDMNQRNTWSTKYVLGLIILFSLKVACVVKTKLFFYGLILL